MADFNPFDELVTENAPPDQGTDPNVTRTLGINRDLDTSNPFNDLKDESPTWGEVGSGFAGNMLGNAVDTGKEMGHALLHPVESGGAIADVAVGGVQKAMGAKVNPEEEKFNSFVNEIKNSYGGIDNIKRTIRDKPFDFLMTIGTLASGVGTVAKAGGLAKTARVASKVGKVLDPVNVVSQGTKSVLQYAFKPERWYGSALKLSTALKAHERAGLIMTGLKEEIMPTDAGLAKMKGIQNKVRADVDRIITDLEKQSTNKGGFSKVYVDTQEVVKRLQPLKEKYAKMSGNLNPESYINMVNELEDNFLKYEGGSMTIRQAQDAKTIANKYLNGKYDEFRFDRAEANKQINRGIKEELQRQNPELGKLNARDSRLIQLEKTIERSLGRIENRDLVGIGTPIVMEAAKSATGLEKASIWAGIGKAIVDHPKFKARVAFALNRARKVAKWAGTDKVPGSNTISKGAYIGSKFNKQKEENTDEQSNMENP